MQAPPITMTFWFAFKRAPRAIPRDLQSILEKRAKSRGNPARLWVGKKAGIISKMDPPLRQVNFFGTHDPLE